MQAADERVQRLTQALPASIAGWRFEPVVAALQALRGVDVISAIGLVAEIGDLSRFEHPRKLMGYLGLVPSEHSSGERIEPRQHHQDGQCPCAPIADRGGVELPLQGPYRATRAQRRQETLSEQIRAIGMESAAAAEQALCRAARPRRAAQQGLRGRGARTGRLHLGHRHGRLAASMRQSLTERSRLHDTRDRSGDATRSNDRATLVCAYTRLRKDDPRS